ncbi:hypothetical protein [Nostoc sp. LEGE 12450]|uniref:hypothetical protein n=1 Tax=Nostoc sp. LEGE 12450 TaxID=1828643 RepID=UPI00187E13C3|nr:hypothetical protein [Nostoc sp. LEGE 12450]MBE8987046.1 hypothetical protein [Nostoc sp. LEGE 12450]
MPKSQGFWRIKKTEFLILDKIERTKRELLRGMRLCVRHIYIFDGQHYKILYAVFCKIARTIMRSHHPN